MRMLPALCALLASSASAQPPLPGCQTNPEVAATLRTKLADRELDQLKVQDRAARVHAVLEDLIARFPRELEPYQQLFGFVWDYEPSKLPAMQTRYRQMAADHADDPLALYLAGSALVGPDTQESVRLWTLARRLAPEFPWPAYRLAILHSTGRFLDKQAAAADVAEFFSLCPAATGPNAQWLLGKFGTSEMQSRAAGALRAQLASESDPEVLRQYRSLWAIELRIHKPQEYAPVLQQMRDDLARIEPLNPQPDAAWLGFLKDAHKQLGDTAAVAALERRILEEFPTSHEAFPLTTAAWKKQHPEPADADDAAGWRTFEKDYHEAVTRWLGEFPEETALVRDYWFSAVRRDASTDEKEGLAAAERFVKTAEEYQPPSSEPYTTAAEFLLDRGWRPERARALEEPGRHRNRVGGMEQASRRRPRRSQAERMGEAHARAARFRTFRSFGPHLDARVAARQERAHQPLGHLVQPLQSGTAATRKALPPGEGPRRYPDSDLQHRYGTRRGGAVPRRERLHVPRDSRLRVRQRDAQPDLGPAELDRRSARRLALDADWVRRRAGLDGEHAGAPGIGESRRYFEA